METLLTAIDIWGLESTVQKLVGMFAFALFGQAVPENVLGTRSVW